MLESKFKLIISDLDGTLLNNEAKINEGSIKTIKNLIKQGHKFCIATGRPKRGAIEFYNQLGLNTVMVNINGSYICNPSDQSFMPLNFTFSKSVVFEIIKNRRILELIHNAVVETAHAEYLMYKPAIDSPEADILSIFHIEIKKDKNIEYLEKLNDIPMDANSVLLIVKEAKNISEIRKIVKTISKTLVVREWSTPVNEFIVVEINSIFATKGMALKFLSAYYNIPLSDTFAFGDGINDIEMLSKAGFGFAMLNASDQVKAIAKFETGKTNYENGVASELKTIFKVKEH